jgi:serine/threonine-protein kinase
MALSAPQDEGELFGRYRLIERIGAGGMAVVYRARPASSPTSPVVVVKRVLPELSRDPSFVKMLVAEARLSSRLLHPNIVRIHEFGRVQDEYFLSMEHVDGVDLVRLLNSCILTRTQVPIDVACYIAQKIAAALSYAHALQDREGRPLEIVHRDVSPGNIMVTFDGQVKLLDFGVAKAAEHVKDDHTRTGTLKGKINYLSPEQAEGLTVDGRSDLFALGIVLHECLTLKRLFRGPSDLVTLRLVRQCEVSPPSHFRPDVPPELDTIVLRMLARDRGQRFAQGEDIAAALTPLVATHGDPSARLAELLRQMPPGAVTAPRPEDEPDDQIDTETLDLEISGVVQSGGASSTVEVSPALQAESAAAPVVPKSVTTDPVNATVRAPRRRGLALAGSAVLLAVAGIVGVVSLRSSASHSTPPAAIAPTAPAPSAPTPSPTPTPTPTAPAPKPPAPAPLATRLSVELDVASAQIFLDGTLVGDGVRRARLIVPRPGQHTLQVVAPRRKPYRRVITVPAGADLELRVTLSRGERPPTSNFQKAKVRTPDGDYLVDPFKP